MCVNNQVHVLMGSTDNWLENVKDIDFEDAKISLMLFSISLTNSVRVPSKMPLRECPIAYRLPSSTLL